jgi:Protein of unknown function (DUF3775)
LSHLDEILAAGFGFNTHAALCADIADIPVERQWRDEVAASRAAELRSAALPAGIVDHPMVTTLGVLRHADAWLLERLAGREIQSTKQYFGGFASADEIIDRELPFAAGGSRDDFKRMVFVLTPEQLWDVQAVMWIERELDSDTWRYRPLFDYARDSHDDGSYGYVASMLGLGKFLRIGLDALAKRCRNDKMQILGIQCHSCRRGLVHILATDEVICSGCWCWGTYQEVIVEGAGLVQPAPVSAAVKTAITAMLSGRQGP